jgi:hypothetical protein
MNDWKGKKKKGFGYVNFVQDLSLDSHDDSGSVAGGPGAMVSSLFPVATVLLMLEFSTCSSVPLRIFLLGFSGLTAGGLPGLFCYI